MRFRLKENRATYGKCNNPHGHGHNYVVEVLAGGAVDAETGMVVDMAALDEVVRKSVVERFDHTNLNLDPLFVNQVPTTENLCRAVFGLLKDALPAGIWSMCAWKRRRITSFSATAIRSSGGERATAAGF